MSKWVISTVLLITGLSLTNANAFFGDRSQTDRQTMKEIAEIILATANKNKGQPLHFFRGDIEDKIYDRGYDIRPLGAFRVEITNKAPAAAQIPPVLAT